MNTTLCLSIGFCCIQAGFPHLLFTVYVGMWGRPRGHTHGVIPKNIIACHHQNLLDFVEQGKIMEAEAPTVQVDATPSKLTAPPSHNRPCVFIAGCPSCRNPHNLSWLGTGTRSCWIAYPMAWSLELVIKSPEGDLMLLMKELVFNFLLIKL